MRYKKNEKQINKIFGRFSDIGGIADSLLDYIDDLNEYEDGAEKPPLSKKIAYVY